MEGGSTSILWNQKFKLHWSGWVFQEFQMWKRVRCGLAWVCWIWELCGDTDFSDSNFWTMMKWKTIKLKAEWKWRWGQIALAFFEESVHKEKVCNRAGLKKP